MLVNWREFVRGGRFKMKGGSYYCCVGTCHHIDHRSDSCPHTSRGVHSCERGVHCRGINVMADDLKRPIIGYYLK